MTTVTLTLSTDAQGDGVVTDPIVRKGYVTSVHFNFAAGTDAGADVALICVSENGPNVTLESITNSATDAWKYPRALTNEPSGAAGTNDTPIYFHGKLRVTIAQGGAEVADAVTVTVTIDKMVGYSGNLSFPTSTVLAIQDQIGRTTIAKNSPVIASDDLFTVSGGPVRLLSLAGLITTVIQTQANNAKLTYTPTGGSAVDLCAVLNVTASAAGKVLVLNGVKATALVLSTDTGVVVAANQSGMPIVLMPGTIALNCTASNTGVVDWYIEFEPMAPGALVTAA